MAVRFRRKLASFASPKGGGGAALRPKKLSYTRARSTSLPGRFHPLVAGLHDSAQALLAWAQAQAQARSDGGWVAEGVGRVGRVLGGLTDLLHHPQAQDPLRRRRSSAPWTERLLEDLLRLADAHGCFRGALVGLKQLLAETHAALRRRDAARLGAALRAQRRADRDLARLASSARDLARHSPAPAPSDAGEAALAAAVSAATAAAAAASAAIFAGVASASAVSAPLAATSPSAASPARAAAAPVWWVADLLRWRRRTAAAAAAAGQAGGGTREAAVEECCGEEEDERKSAMARLQRLGECVGAAEGGCEDVYRALVNARVSLLNILTPSF